MKIVIAGIDKTIPNTEAYRKLLKALRPEPDLTPVEPPDLDQFYNDAQLIIKI